MNLKTTFSFLLLFIINYSCKPVYEVDISQPSNETSPFHVFFINRNLNENLGAIVTDTSKREINYFYGDKNSRGTLVNVKQIVTYLPNKKRLINVELDENLFPQRIISLKNDSTLTIEFKNYDLKANTVDIDIYDTRNTLVQSSEKISCGNALLKFKEAKKILDSGKGLRLATGMSSANDDCSAFLNSMSTAANGIGCILGLAAVGPAILSAPTGIGLVFLAADIAFTIYTCTEFLDGITAIFRGECIDSSKMDKVASASECLLNVIQALKTLNISRLQGIISCATNAIDTLSDIVQEILHPTLPSGPNASTDYPGGRSFGDPNIVTFDGKSYSFNGVGEFIAVKSTTDNFEIQVRQEELKSRSSSGSISWNTGLAINTGSDRLCFYPGKYFINGTQYAYSSSINNSLQNDGSITGNSSTITINNGRGDIIKVFNHNDAIDYSIIPSTKRQGKMNGIFGDYNSNTDNDVQIRNSSIIDGSYSTLYPTFTDSWRINQDQSLFIYDGGKNTVSYTDKNFPRVPLVITASQRANAEQICKSAGVGPPFLEGCINDVVVTGDASIAKRAKDMQDENLLKSFDIKFGPNDDKSLLLVKFNADKYGPDYLLCEPFVYPEIFRSVSIVNGFESVIYMASETPDPRGSILSSQLALNFLSSGLGWTISGGSSYNYYDPMLNLLTAIDPKLFIFDGKIHKVAIQSTIDLATKLSSYKLLVDDVLLLERKDFAIRAFSVQDKLPFNLGVNLKFGSATGAPNVKLYRWSFKSY
jgi:hypothetical protein